MVMDVMNHDLSLPQMLVEYHTKGALGCLKQFVTLPFEFCTELRTWVFGHHSASSTLSLIILISYSFNTGYYLCSAVF